MKTIVQISLVLVLGLLLVAPITADDNGKPSAAETMNKEAMKAGTSTADKDAATTAVQPPKYAGIGAGIGMGLSIVGAGLGIGLIGFSAFASMARQPEQANRINGAMILLAALVEGAAIISLVLCLVLALA